MKKILLILVLLFTSNILYAGQIKLSCDINLTYTPSVEELPQKVREIYVIDESTNISIYPLSNPGSLPMASSHKYNPTNYSNQNKWDIQNKYTINGTSYITSVIIDRNSGQIFTSLQGTNKNGLVLTVSGNGICEKIDTQKKKF